MKFLKTLFIFINLSFSLIYSQNKIDYIGEKDKVHVLEHTKLKVDFNFKKKELNGQAWITLKPYFYSTNKLSLDAKGMIIHQVSLNNKNLDFNYNNYNLLIDLPKEFKKKESYTIYIKYTARPDKIRGNSNETVKNQKGLYFINADRSDKNKPTQIWTQGQTESSSCWFPTIDSPNQKTSQEIYITVPNKFKTLSNGKLISQTIKGEDRIDYWKLDKKHAPYLFFMGIGEFEIIKDSYKNIPLEYYVEKEYATHAKDIFGDTPKMLGFFSDILGVEYPWNKYSQIVVRDYISGAMENTTAVVHGEQAYQRSGQLIDENKHENIIAHEVFHHWFGNLVTAESWSNIALNESFANYGEYLWREHKYGKEDANALLHENNLVYLNGQNSNKSLVRFNYRDREDLFDLVSYNKGGAVLHMLRNYLGDNAFFKGLNIYLTEFKYKSAEVHDLRLVFEKLTGKDLNWFFNQWFYNTSHPQIEISYDYNIIQKKVTVNVIQLQSEKFKFPFTIDIYEKGNKRRETVFVDGNDASFTYSYLRLPDYIQVNADGVLLCEIQENKVLSDYIFQLKNAENYIDRKSALLEIIKKQDNKVAFKAVVSALYDSFYKIRILALENIDLINKFSKKAAIRKISEIAKTDKKTLVKAAAIETLGKLIDPELKSVFEQNLNSESYAVVGKSLVAMYYVDKKMAIEKSKSLPNEIRKILATPLTQIYIEEKDEKELPFIAQNVLSGMYLNGDDKTKSIYKKAFKQISESNNTKAIKNLVEDMILKGNQYKNFNFDKVVINLMREMIQKQKKVKKSNKKENIKVIKTAMAELI